MSATLWIWLKVFPFAMLSQVCSSASKVLLIHPRGFCTLAVTWQGRHDMAAIQYCQRVVDV